MYLLWHSVFAPLVTGLWPGWHVSHDSTVVHALQPAEQAANEMDTRIKVIIVFSFEIENQVFISLLLFIFCHSMARHPVPPKKSWIRQTYLCGRDVTRSLQGRIQDFSDGIQTIEVFQNSLSLSIIGIFALVKFENK